MTEIGGSAQDYTIAVPGADGAVVRLSWAAATDTGLRRAANEDSFVAVAPIFAVADGMGGHAAGDLASAAVVERLGKVAGRGFLTPIDIEKALEAATTDISELSVDSVLGVGTTVTGIVLATNEATASFAVFNIGDSRVYCFDAQELFQVTVDHSVVQELVDAGALTREEADHHPDSNVITRAVGFNARPIPDFWMVQLRPGLRFLVCTDGLTKELSDDRISAQLAAGLGAQETARALIDAALAAGGRDNVTVVVVDVIEAPEALDSEDTAPRGSRD